MKEVLRYGEASNVYYRFGSFQHLEMEQADGVRTLAIRDPVGNLVPDTRVSETARPDWVFDPFEGQQPPATRSKTQHPLDKSFRVCAPSCRGAKAASIRPLI